MGSIFFQVKRPFVHGFVAVLAAIIMVAAFPGKGFAQQGTYRMKIVVFGDSILAGRHLLPEERFAARLERRLLGVGYQVDVIDMSNADETTASAASRVEQVAQLNPDLVLVEIGMNDVLRGMEIKNIYNNLHQILYRLRFDEQGKPTGTYVFFLGVQASATQPYTYRTQLQQSLDRITDVHSVSFYPNVLDGITGVPSLSLADGLHPNSEGINVLIENLLPTVDSLLRYRLQYLIQKSAVEQQQQAPHAY